MPIWSHLPLDVLLLQVQCHSSFQFLAVLKTLKPTLTALQVRPRVKPTLTALHVRPRVAGQA